MYPGKMARLASELEQALGKDEYTNLLKDDTSVQKYLDAGKRLSFEFLLPSVPISSLADFSPDQKDCYWSAIRKEMVWVPNEDEDWEKIAEDTATALWDLRRLAEDGLDVVRRKGGSNLYDAIGNLYYNSVSDSHNLGASRLIITNFNTQDFDISLIPYCAKEDVPVQRRKVAIERAVKNASNKEEISNNWKDRWTELMDSLTEIKGRPRLRTDSASESDTGYPRVSCYNVDQLLTPDILSEAWLLQMATSLAIKGLLAIGTEEAKISSLILSAADYARQQKESDPPTIQMTLDEAFDINQNYYRELRAFWSFTATDFHTIFRWLEDGAAMVDVPEVLRWYLEDEENNHLYRRVAMQMKGYWKANKLDMSNPDDLEGKSSTENRPVVIFEDNVLKIDGKTITDEEYLEKIRKFNDGIERI
ncbi:hypothetical protein VI817_006311 [Penicillium citrinum]|nr:hypothetical protein VI817_006311 [Penicillium citrinum]